MGLIVLAHPDDELLMMGGAIAAMKNEGREFEYLFIGKGRGDKLDQKFDTIPLLSIVQKIEAKIQEVRPMVIYTHWEYDCNEDHRIVFRAVEAAARPQGEYPVRELYSGEVPSYSNRTFDPDTFVEIDAKTKWRNFCDLYPAEVRAYPHPRSFEYIQALARCRGAQVGVPYAEAFKTIRRIC